jgi:hypothetical protein
MTTTEITITTRRGTQTVDFAAAVLSASRARRPHTRGGAEAAARWMVEAPHGVKGRIVAAAMLVHRARQADRDQLTVPIRQRLAARLLQLGLAEIDRRRLSIPAGWDDFPRRIIGYLPSARIWLIHGEGWYEYSRRHGRRHQAAAYLIGRDEGQIWAVRVPSTVRTVGEATEWLRPRAIREALQARLPVKRQGDIYFRPVRSLSGHDLEDLSGTRHEARPRTDGGLTIVHPEHRPIVLSGRYTWRACRQMQIDGNRRRGGD